MIPHHLILSLHPSWSALLCVEYLYGLSFDNRTFSSSYFPLVAGQCGGQASQRHARKAGCCHSRLCVVGACVGNAVGRCCLCCIDGGRLCALCRYRRFIRSLQRSRFEPGSRGAVHEIAASPRIRTFRSGSGGDCVVTAACSSPACPPDPHFRPSRHSHSGLDLQRFYPGQPVAGDGHWT